MTKKYETRITVVRCASFSTGKVMIGDAHSVCALERLCTPLYLSDLCAMLLY